jgi:hypothetical protein
MDMSILNTCHHDAWEVGYTSDYEQDLRQEEAEKAADCGGDWKESRGYTPGRSNPYSKIEPCSVWIHRANAMDIWVTFTYIKEAYEFGVSYLREHSSYVCSSSDDMYTSQSTWIDAHGLKWVSDFTLNMSLEEVWKNGQYESQLGSGPVIQIVVYRGHSPPKNHLLYYEQGIMKLPPALAFICGTQGSPGFVPFIADIHAKEPLVYNWILEYTKDWKDERMILSNTMGLLN